MTPLGNLDLALAAQASAAKGIKAAADPLTTLNSAIADFTSTGNPNADWLRFKQAYDRAAQEYKALAAADAQAAKTAQAPPGGTPAGTAGTAVPPALAALLEKRAASAAPGGAPVPPANAA